MNILLIGKFPPIEGGVSAQTFWLARSLVRGGHKVRVVTNASEVEPTFRQLHYGQDHQYLEETENNNTLQIYHTTPLTSQSFIPFAQPYSTKLFGLSLSVLEEHDCDVIVSWYFEPYGVVAAFVGQATGRPFIIRHAGSDLGRLAYHPELAAAYRWALTAAAGLVITNERELEQRFGRIDRPRLHLTRPQLPDIFFSPEECFDIKELLANAGSWFLGSGLPEELLRDIERINAKVPRDKVFTIGVYGKVGVTKGSFDLIDALARVAQAGTEFVFLTVSCGQKEILQSYYEAIMHYPELTERTWILPPIAPWRIPGLLRTCDAVCFLERDFSISFHGPLIPREVLSSGACLVCSAEVSKKPIYQDNLVNDRNAVIIADPRNLEALAHRLGQLISDQERTRSIGLQGQKLARFWNDELQNVDAATKLFSTQLQRLIRDWGSKLSANKD